MYENAPVTISADQALAALDGKGESRAAKAEAETFLAAVLSNGPVPHEDAMKEAASAGISAKRIRTAREKMGVTTGKSGFDVGWLWELRRCPERGRRCPP